MKKLYFILIVLLFPFESNCEGWKYITRPSKFNNVSKYVQDLVFIAPDQIKFSKEEDTKAWIKDERVKSEFNYNISMMGSQSLINYFKKENFNFDFYISTPKTNGFKKVWPN